LIIDFHNHFYPEEYIRELNSGEGYARVTADSQGRDLIEYVGDYNVVVGPHIKLEDRLVAMDKYGIDMQVLSLTTPGVEREKARRGIKLAKLANDEFGAITEKYPDRFCALVSLPVQDPEASVDELDRAVRDRGLRGVMLFSNANGKPLDSKELVPIYEKAAKLDVPLFIHPTSPINASEMYDYRLVPIIGFTVDTSLALLRLVFSGILERLPNLKIVVAHTGGVFPYLRGRIEIGYEAYPECRMNISAPPSVYFKKNVWVDTVCYDPDVLMSTYSFLGHEKILLGTDYPHQISDMENAVIRVKKLNIGDMEKVRILGENASKLLKLK
jgi:aminocarboxymuconate-semialdehyde decarboxylase